VTESIKYHLHIGLHFLSLTVGGAQIRS